MMCPPSDDGRSPRNYYGYGANTLWFQYILCQQESIPSLACWLFTSGWNQADFGQYYLYDNLSMMISGLLGLMETFFLFWRLVVGLVVVFWVDMLMVVGMLCIAVQLLKIVFVLLVWRRMIMGSVYLRGNDVKTAFRGMSMENVLNLPGNAVKPV